MHTLVFELIFGCCGYCFSCDDFFVPVLYAKPPTLQQAWHLHIGLWIFTFVINLIPVFGYGASASNRKWIGQWKIAPDGANCLAGGRDIYTAVIILVYAILVFGGILYGYFRIAWHVRSVSRTTASTFRAPRSRTRDVNRSQSTRVEERITRSCIVLSAAIIFCWTPVALAFYWNFITDTQVNIEWDVIRLMMARASFLINPIVCSYIDDRVWAQFSSIFAPIIAFARCRTCICRDRDRSQCVTPAIHTSRSRSKSAHALTEMSVEIDANPHL